jgi:hypothetical protein
MLEPLHPLARGLVDDYLALVDARLPGIIQGLYLVGSIALDDFQPGTSDVDFVALSTEALDETALDRLEEIHAQLRVEPGRPSYDGLYLRWEHLSGPPELAQPPPFHLGGQFNRHEAAFEANPAVWKLLGDRGVAVRGPEPHALQVQTDRKDLASWTLDNLNSYWAGLVDRAHQVLAARAEDELFDAEVPVWGVLGIPRLHATLVTGEIVSKSGAGEYSLERFPERWGTVVRSCLRIRREAAGERAWLPVTQAREAVDFMEFVIADANQLSIEF